MKRKSYEEMTCPIARTLERVGEWWSILIIRDAAAGLTKFDEFEKSLGISPNILSRRLATLVDNGFLEKQMYSESPPRMEYRLTERGKGFESVLQMLSAFGNDQFADEGVSLQVVNRRTGKAAKLTVVDANTGRPATQPDYQFMPGPAANAAMKAKFANKQTKKAA
jgi:DNA-binding HxlR family transcriptional regulator